jgi:hypothetical protein
MLGFRLEIHDRRVRLVHIFRARMWSVMHDPQAMATLMYRKLIEVLEQAAVEVEGKLCPA